MTSLLTVKLVRDLKATWPRLTMMVIAIAISLSAFGGVLFAWSASGRETDGAYARTEPASATILLDQAVDAERLVALAAQAERRPDVLVASARTQFTSEVTVDGRIREIPLQVFAAGPDDAMRVARFDVDQASWPPTTEEIFLGADSLSLLGVSLGDTLTLETPAGDPLRVRVAATVYDPSLAPSPQEQTGHGYLASTALGTAGRAAELDQLKLQVPDPATGKPTRDRDAIVTAANDVGSWLEQEAGVTVREIQVPEPFEHPHQWQADALLVSLLAGGAAALLLSTILVANMLNNMFTRQIPQIGIMKATGASSVQIGRHYLATTLVVALAATALAVPVAVALGRVAVGTFLGFLGIEPVSLAPPWWTYAVVVVIGLALPPLMAVVPVVRTSRTTVRAAIDHHGGGTTPHAATGVLARIGRIRGLNRGLLMALRNTVRRPSRFLLSVGLLAAAGTVFVSGMSLSTGTEAITEEQKSQVTWDVEVQLAVTTTLEEVTELAQGVPGVQSVEALQVLPAGVAGEGEIPITRTYPDQGHGRVSVTALPGDRLAATSPKLLDGRWLREGETGAVVLNQLTRKNTVPGIRSGDTVRLTLNGRSTSWRVTGVIEELAGGSGGVYTTTEGLAQALGQPARANQLRITTDAHDEQTRQAVAAAVGQALTDAGIEVRSAVSISRSEAISAGHLGPIVLILLGVALPLGVVGTIGLASTMSANILDRTREFAIMHAIGARPRAVRRIVIAEGLFLALASCLAAILPTLGLTAVLGDGLGNLFFSAPLPYRISAVAAGIWVAIVVLGSLLATDAAATRASRLTVRDGLAYL
ncbi:ABC transporter permease [Nocardioides speluncae]|uniref:ABC transporter permease n=1 Tax=Nocardioides speluncae TaxID=2670337 RepID=UPI000D695D4C|nr:ABC transporter permease [Nocardioides speluncae]